MAKRKTSITENRITRSSGILNTQESFIPKKQKKTDSGNRLQVDPPTTRDEEVQFVEPSKKEIHLPVRLSDDLIPHFRVQRQTVLRALKEPNLIGFHSPETKASEQLKELIHGTVHRQEGNSCLILGSRGSGKTRLVEDSLSSFKSMARPPIIMRLSGHSQLNDRLAMREILRQVQEQSGIDVQIETEEVDNQLQYEETDSPQEVDLSLPPSSHLPQLIGSLPNLGRPVIIILDAFDKFTEHARQALLYCLLDTVQSCRGELIANYTENQSESLEMVKVTQEHGKATSFRKECGLLVVGITSRIDCLTLLEKRVKSRFSHRVLRLYNSHNVPDMLHLFKEILTTDPGLDYMLSEEWQAAWSKCIEDFLSNQEVQDTFKEMYMFTKDIRSFVRLLSSCVASLTPGSPWLKPSLLQQNAVIQRCRSQFPFLKELAYPHLSLLIAAMHVFVAGQETLTFELLNDKYMTQVRLTTSAPVNSERGEIGMPFISRNVLLGAFENLVDNRVFHPAQPHASHISKEFMQYHCKATREDVKNVIDDIGHPGLRKWFYKSQ